MPTRIIIEEIEDDAPEQSNMGAIFALIAFALLAALWWWG